MIRRARRKPRHAEAEIGRELMRWVALREGALPRLEWFHHVPNGGGRTEIEGALLKAEGVRAGVWDYLLPGFDATGRHIGLYIELKAPDQRTTKHGGLTDKQVRFGHAMTAECYLMRVCYAWDEAAAEIERYLIGGSGITAAGTSFEQALQQGRRRAA